ncbi:MAG: leucine--tRNA ligase [Candidatus Altiarchaeota archaeon]|nr:leucine--tRNA ligase [Candidatus Altiarchaeota archaeon]
MTSKFNPTEIQDKWINKWKKEKIFEAKPDPDREKFYLTVAFPYPSGSMHVGHGRTYTVPDVIARFKRMQGFNVLFPMAWHVTGSPVLGIAERIKKRDEKALKLYGGLYKVPEETLKSFTEPENIVKYFSDEYKDIMNRMGFSIDWNREFYSITPQYSKFIEWQYKRLYDQGLVRKGEHPVRYCPSCDNPVGDHDLMEGENASINEFIILKFKINSLILPAATLRPETVFGVTNMWLNPNIVYKKVRVNGEEWLLSKEALEKLKYFDKDITVLGEIKGEDLIGKSCIDPVSGKEVPILPAGFVDPDYATGVVMSVPAHAPYDYIALKDLGSDIGSVTIIEAEGGKEKNPAKEIVEEMGIENQGDVKLEEATEILYRAEHSKGFMLKSIEKYGGLSVREAREELSRDLLETKKGDIFYEFSEKPVVCRCGSTCVIKILKDQWFVGYGNSEWKSKTEECLQEMEIIPKETRQNFSYFIGWLRDWACTRKVGLGTKLPWDSKWIIEPLSDSTIYMSYYTIAPYLRELDPEKLKPEFFDYIFLGEGDVKGIPRDKLDEIRDEFRYWYPAEWRLSAKDLVGNHLTFHIFHHTALFPKEFWPKGIVVFGMGLLEGDKMSSSKGNVILLSDAVEGYGSDVVRLFLMSNAEPWQDFDWRESLVKNTAKKLKQFYDQVNYFITLEDDIEVRDIDRWLIGRMHESIEKTTSSLENFQIRKALQHALFDVLNDVIWYSRRCTPNAGVMKDFADSWIRLMAPFTPFTCEELWEVMHGGEKGFVTNSTFPEVRKELINEKISCREEVIKNLMGDIQNILEVMKVKPNKILLYLASEWKRRAYEAIKQGVNMPELMKDPQLRPYGKEIAKLMKTRRDEIPRVILSLEEEHETLADAKDFLSKQFNAEIEVQKTAGYDPAKKAGLALPMKPGIYIE